MPEKKTLNEDLFYKGSSANLPRLHTCKNKVPFWDFKEFAVTVSQIQRNDIQIFFVNLSFLNSLPKSIYMYTYKNISVFIYVYVYI